MANCAREFLLAVTGLAIVTQESDIDPSIVGKAVVRDGEMFNVTGIKFTTRKISVTDSAGRKRTLSFDSFFNKRVKIIDQVEELVKLTADSLSRSWTGRLLFDAKGNEWKILKVGDQPGIDEWIVTLRGPSRQIVVMSGSELESAGFKFKRSLAPSITQRLAGAYVSEMEGE